MRTRGSGSGIADSRATLYGWRGSSEELIRRGDLDQLAEIHHADAIAHVLDDGQVVGDEQVGEVEFASKVEQQVEYLRLDRDVEGRDSFVADDELRIEGQRAGDADALALAA